MVNSLVTQIVRTITQYAWSLLASWGILELVNQQAAEAWLTALLTGVIIAALSWLERRFPWIGNLFIFAKTPTY